MSSAADEHDSGSSYEHHGVPKGRRFASSKGEGLWLLSFGDLCLILISFFILLLSYSTMNQKKAETMREAMQAKTAAANQKQDSLTTVSKKIEAEIKRLNLDKNAEVKFDDRGVVIEFKDGILFDVGSAAANAKYETTVANVLKVIAATPQLYQLQIEGHTDDVPIKSSQFASNWELSSARAIALMRQFSRRGVDEKRMSVVSYAHTRPKTPISGLSGQELTAARAANRRVVIRIEPK